MNRSTIVIILGAELRAWRNRVTKGSSRRLVLLGIVLLVGGLFIGGSMFGLADAASAYVPYARDPMLVGAFSALSVLMLVIGFPTVIATFFVGSDLMQLVIAPVRPLEIFLARSVLAIRANLLLGFVIACFAIGVGVGSGAPPIFYLLGLLFVVLVVLAVTALQTVLMSIVLRWVPPRAARDVAVLVASVTGAGLYLLWNLTFRQAVVRPGRPNVSGLIDLAGRIEWVPTAWPGHALSAVIDGTPLPALAWTAVTVAISALLVLVAGLLYGQTLLAGMGQLGGVQARWRPSRTKPERAAHSGAASPEMAIARKDWLVYRRDIRRLGRLLPAMIFLVAYAFVLVRPTRAISTFWYDVFIVAFISMFISTAVATSSVPAERRGFQLLRLAPVTAAQILRAKILYTLFPLVVFVVVISLGVAVAGHNTVVRAVALAVLATWLALGFVSIGVSAGALDPRFESTDERRMVGPAGTIAGLVAEIGFGGLSILSFLLLVVAIEILRGAHFGPLPASPAWAATYVLLAIFLAVGGVGVVGVLLKGASNKLRTFEASITST